MLSEEEKKAIEYLKLKTEDILPLYTEMAIDGKIYKIDIVQPETKWSKETASNVSRILNLIENLKDKYILEKVAKKEVEELLENSISKDIIKNKIKEKQDKINKLHSASDCVIIDDLENEISVLQELLGDK